MEVEPLIEEKDSRWKFKNPGIKGLLIFFLVFIFINLIYIDLLLIQGLNKQTIVQKFESIASSQTTPQPLATQNPDVCPQGCLTQITNAINSSKTAVVTPSPIVTPAPSQNTNTAFSQIKEYYVPFGSGSGSYSDWTNVPGLQASVDSSAYGTIKSVVFEASLHIPTGNETASVRLYDVTQGHPVWNSEIDFNGNTNSVFLASPNINLDAGNNVYAVQMKTQLQYNAVLDQSRIHITTQ